LADWHASLRGAIEEERAVTSVKVTWHNYIDEVWLARGQEPVLDLHRPIVDPHHHLWKPMNGVLPYGLADWLKDLASGHNIVATVHTQAHSGYRSDGPPHLRPVGETEFLVDVAEKTDQIPGIPRICAGITGAGDLTADAGQVDEMLEAHIIAGKGRFRGIRIIPFTTMDMTTLETSFVPGWEEVLDRADWREGIRCLTRKALTLDVMAFHLQLPYVARLARAFPDTVIVLNHLAIMGDLRANPVPIAQQFEDWRRGIEAIAPYPNVNMKIGGCANPLLSMSLPQMMAFRARPTPPTSQELADVYRPLVSYVIDNLGPARCMFESNFAIEKAITSYRTLWNAFKILAMPYTEDEQRMLFGGTANRAYKLDLPEFES
jgi:L-fuconolactonase